MTTTVFICDRGRGKESFVKLQLEIPRTILDRYKELAKNTPYTPKQMMENMLRNWADGVEDR